MSLHARAAKLGSMQSARPGLRRRVRGEAQFEN